MVKFFNILNVPPPNVIPFPEHINCANFHSKVLIFIASSMGSKFSRL